MKNHLKIYHNYFFQKKIILFYLLISILSFISSAYNLKPYFIKIEIIDIVQIYLCVLLNVLFIGVSLEAICIYYNRNFYFFSISKILPVLIPVIFVFSYLHYLIFYFIIKWILPDLYEILNTILENPLKKYLNNSVVMFLIFFIRFFSERKMNLLNIEKNILEKSINLAELENIFISVENKEYDRKISIISIMYIASKRNYSHIVTDKEVITVKKSLKAYEETLPAGIFMRVHNSYLVNKYYIESFMHSHGGQYCVELNDGSKTRINVSRNCVIDVREFLKTR